MHRIRKDSNNSIDLYFFIQKDHNCCLNRTRGGKYPGSEIYNKIQPYKHYSNMDIIQVHGKTQGNAEKDDGVERESTPTSQSEHLNGTERQDHIRSNIEKKEEFIASNKKG